MPLLGSLKKSILTLIFCLFLFCGPSDARTSFPLDEENVFCLYHWLSSEPMSDQDIEDLCFAMGRPVFSAYKPAEMFVKPTIQAVRTRLLKKMKEYGSSPVFIWIFDARPKRGRAGLARIRDSELPHATSLIRSMFPPQDLKSIEETLHRSFDKKPDLSNDPVRITIQARPQGVDRHPERRIIAGAEVRIPIRTVVFHPVEIEISEERHAIHE